MPPELGRAGPSRRCRTRGWVASLEESLRRPRYSRKELGSWKARKTRDTVTSEAVDQLADADPEPWSVQAVERAEAVADDALAETKLAFSDGVARSMVEPAARC